MMLYCRSSFSTILEMPGLLSKILLDKFYPSLDLYNDLYSNNKIIEFEDYIYNLSGITINNSIIDSTHTPKEIFNKLGYDFYECKTEEDINSFKKYYAKGEKLCTFESNRLLRCYIFWVVKRNALQLKREDYLTPNREDEYGTSVMSIQFDKSKYNRLSIKNRYNDAINNPDATYGNNLDNIYPGLTRSFFNTYGLIAKSSLESNFSLDNHVYASDKKYYKYNYNYNGIYYTTNNIIIDSNKINTYPKEKYIIFDYFVLDLVNKQLYCYDNKIEESFPKVIGNIKYINIYNDKENNCKHINITNDKQEKYIITLSKDNKLINIENDTCQILPDRFLIMNRFLKQLNLNKITTIGNQVLYSNTELEYINCECIVNIGDDFLRNNINLSFIILPNCKKIGSYFLSSNRILTNISIPKVEEIGNNFLFSNLFIKNIDSDKLKIIGNNFLYNNDNIKVINLNSVIKIGNFFMFNNKKIEHINMNNLEIVGSNFLINNLNVIYINLPNIKFIDKYFMSMNQLISYINIPNIEYISDYFLYKNKCNIDIIYNKQVICENKVNKIIQDIINNNIKDNNNSRTK